MNNLKNIIWLNQVKEQLQATSNSFCLAKWTQTTLYLQHGFNHSCHHPPPHKVSVEELAENPAAFHNSKHKVKMRELMLNGERPAECDYCWRIEDFAPDNFSDRVYKSAATWSWRYKDKILENPRSNDLGPTYLEISFSNTCNFKCMYCTPDVSSPILEEAEKFGPYPISTPMNDLNYLKSIGKFPYKVNEENPYVELFWQWWPNIYKDLHTLRVTGGEPTLSKDFWKLLDFLIENPNPSLTLAINSNLGGKDSTVERLIEKINALEGKVKAIQLFTSNEAVGAQAEYIRYGLDYNKWLFNIRKILSSTNPHVNISLMTTINALSIFTFDLLINEMLALREEFNLSNCNRILISYNYIRWPRFMQLQVLPDDLKNLFKQKIAVLKTATVENKKHRFDFLSLEEIDQLDRLSKILDEPLEDLDILRKDFFVYFTEYDQRRGTNFLEIFPELKNFYKQCENKE